MDITETRVKLAENQQERLLAFCTLTLDDAFVIRDVKIIEGPRGPFIAMPSRKVMGRCDACGDKNHLRANFCNHCGERLFPEPNQTEDNGSRTRLYVDIAHPINQESRARIEQAALKAFKKELDRSQKPGYVAPDLDESVAASDNHRRAPSNNHVARSETSGEGGGRRRRRKKPREISAD